MSWKIFGKNKFLPAIFTIGKCAATATSWYIINTN